MAEARTFRVMDTKGNTLSKVMTAATERDSDSTETFVAKRRDEAMRKRGRWQDTLYPDEVLLVVPCDGQGTPLIKRHRFFDAANSKEGQ